MKQQLFYFFIFLLAACNNNQPAPLIDKNSGRDSINEKKYITLGGEKQYVEITGRSNENPVLLFLHGGPGWPQTPHLRYFNTDLANSVVLVSWDQRGCGKSYMLNPEPKDLSIQKLISDAHELTLILKKRFHQDKIYLAGFSWGSVIGMHLVKQYPEDYAAYFGISQVIDFQKSMTLSSAWLKEQATLKKDRTMLKNLIRLEKNDPSLCKDELACFQKRNEYLRQYGGAIYTRKTEEQIRIAEATYADYRDYNWQKGFEYSSARIGDTVSKTNLTNIGNLEVPVYFFVGRHDWILPSVIIEEFYERLSSPQKELVWFENSGHEPPAEEPQAFNKAIADRIKKD